MMRHIFFIALLAFSLGSCSQDMNLKVISLNIRYDNPRDGANAWPNRKEMVVSFLEENKPDIFGLQEVLWHQFSYIDSSLNAYSSVGAGRTDGIKAGEMTPVFYNKKRFDLLESSTFWLSETPEVPGSKGWGAVLPRIVTWVKLSDNESGVEFYYFNTHYSHMSDSARLMSSSILSEEVQRISGDSFFVISGDFNMSPESSAYSVLTANSANFIKDSYVLSSSSPTGPASTFNGFKDKEGASRIDYIFAREGVKIGSHSTIISKSGGVFLSDHWPVIANLAWSF